MTSKAIWPSILVFIFSSLWQFSDATAQSAYTIIPRGIDVHLVNPQTGEKFVKSMGYYLHSAPLNYQGQYPLRTRLGRTLGFSKLFSQDFTTQEKLWIDLDFEKQNAADGFNAQSRYQSSSAVFDCFTLALAGDTSIRLSELYVNVLLADDFKSVGSPTMYDSGLRRGVGCSGTFNFPSHATLVTTELQPTGIPGILAPISFGVAKCGVCGIYRTSLSGMMGAYDIWPDVDYYIPK